MIERGFGPIFYVGVAVDAGARLAGKACGSSYRIAAGANLLISSIKQRGFDNLAVMTGRVIGRMAGTAFKDDHVFVIFYIPAFGVGMAVDAGAGVVTARIGLPVAGVTFGHGRMVIF